MTLIFIYLIGALGLSFLCSILEAVLLSTPISFIAMKENEGVKYAKLLREYKTNSDRPIAAILSLNTIAHTIGAAGVGAQATEIFGEEYFGIVSAILTILILVLSEIIPKNIGATQWRKLALPAAQIIHAMVILCYPLVILSEYITKLTTPKNKPKAVSREEVSAMVNVGVEEGVIKTKENRVIQSFLKLVNVRAEEIMTPKSVVASTSQNITLEEFYNNKDLTSFSRIPVYHNDKRYITGYVLRDTALENLTEDKFNIRLSELARPILTFKPSDAVSDIWEQLLSHKEHISVIVDKDGVMLGIVTMEDVIETMLGVEIVDENDIAEDMQLLAEMKG